MRIGVFIEETWSFFSEIYADLNEHHQTSLYQRRLVRAPFFRERINRFISRRSLEEFIRKNDILFFEWASELLMTVSHMPKLKPIVTRLHRYELYQWTDLINWKNVDRIILVTEAKRQEFTRRYPEQALKTVVIPEAVSLERFQSRIKPFEGDLGIMCHLTPRKRVYELILAFYELIQESPTYRLHIGGGKHVLHGDYYEAMSQLVERLGLGEMVIFYGAVSEPEDWYRKIDIFISNSYSEGLQVSPLEAIASGCYCLSHRWAGAEEFYPDENLYDTDRQLIEKIHHYSQLSQAEKNLKIQGLQSILGSSFNIEKTKIEIRQLLETTAIHKPAGKLL